MPTPLMHEDGSEVAVTAAARIRAELQAQIDVAVYNIERRRGAVGSVPQFLVAAAHAAAAMHANVLGERIAGIGKEANDVALAGTAGVFARALAEMYGRLR